MSTVERQSAASPAAASAEKPSGSDYEPGLKCRICYMKHLSKASIEIGEYVEDSDRYPELALGIGDMACAEDHARALGLDGEASEIRLMRTDVLGASKRSQVPGRLLALAARQAREISSGAAPTKQDVVREYAARTARFLRPDGTLPDGTVPFKVGSTRGEEPQK